MKSTLKLPVLQADKRYYSLNHRGENNDIWGIISDVTVQSIQTIITLRSMLKVSSNIILFS